MCCLPQQYGIVYYVWEAATQRRSVTAWLSHDHRRDAPFQCSRGKSCDGLNQPWDFKILSHACLSKDCWPEPNQRFTISLSISYNFMIFSLRGVQFRVRHLGSPIFISAGAGHMASPLAKWLFQRMYLSLAARNYKLTWLVRFEASAQISSVSDTAVSYHRIGDEHFDLAASVALNWLVENLTLKP